MIEARRPSEQAVPPRVIVRLYSQTFVDFDRTTGVCLIPFLNRPFLFHVIDTLVSAGAKEIQFVGFSSAAYEMVLGNGERWGVRFVFGEAEKDSTESTTKQFAAHALPFSSGTGETTEPLRVDSPELYLTAQRSVMRASLADYLTVERELLPQVWCHRNVTLHPSVKLEGPVLIGENTRVAAGVTLGPFTVIGANCYIDRNSSLRDSCVFPNVYVGEGLDAHGLIIDSNTVHNIRLNAKLQIKDDLVVGRFP